jgi:hypothetical protein
MGEHLKNTAEKFEQEGKGKFTVGSGLTSDFHNLGQATKDIAMDSYGAVKNEFNDLYKQSREKVTEVGTKVGGHFRSHPVQALLIASGVGLIVGWFIRRKV